MRASSTEIERAALVWLIRVNDPGFEAWDAWDRWMTADPQHAETYWRLAEIEANAVEVLAPAPVRPSGGGP